MKTSIKSGARGVAIALCAFGIFSGVHTYKAKADMWDKRTILTVHEPIQVRDTVLPPGQYVFKLASSDSNRHIVQIFNRDETRIIDTELANPNWRNEVSGKSTFTFYETPAGYNKALRAWFYPGDNFGQEFTYPKHLQQVAMVKTTETTTTAMAAPAPAPAMQEEQTTSSSQELQDRTEIAQNTPPPAPAPAETQSDNSMNTTTNTTIEEPRTLPKTATPYPLIGASGLMLIGLGGLLRRRIV
jgi:LPXTG-motif cell wall-anchored protein